MANRRFEMYEYRQVLTRMRLGESDRAIARSGLIGRQKASALREVASREGWLEASSVMPDDATLAQVLQVPCSRPQSAASVLPYQDKVTAWWRQGIRGTVIHQALVDTYGYAGSYSFIRRFLQGLKDAHPDVTTVLDFDPGDVDLRNGAGLVSPPVCRDRAGSKGRDVAFLPQKRLRVLRGVPARVVIDNPKNAITRACYHDPEVQRAYGECAEGYGFTISPCPVRDPKKKGRVEAAVKYVKRSFVPLRQFRGIRDANRQLQAWIQGVAGNRIHSTTHERPLTRFVQTERGFLKPLPAHPPEQAAWAKVKVHGDCHVQFEKCRYSVPYALVRQQLWLRASPTTVWIYHNQEMVAVHSHKNTPGARSTVNEHWPPEARAFLMRDPQWYLKKAQTIGPFCHGLIKTLFSNRVLDNLRAAQGIIRLSERYGGPAPATAPWPLTTPATGVSKASSKKAWTNASWCNTYCAV